MLATNICLYMASLRPFSKCWPQKMTLMAAECGYNCSSYRIGYLETTSIGMNDKATCFNSNISFYKEIMILIPTTIDKWHPRDHFEMLDLENG